jgi:hypothetical protein
MKRMMFLMLGALLFSCQRPESGDPITLRTYEVPSGQGAQLRGLLNMAFVTGDKAPPTAKATLTPDGRLVVVGPEKIQEGVSALVNELANKPAATPPTVQIEYWLVLGKPGQPQEPTGALKTVAPALQTIESQDGPLELHLLEHLQARSISSDEAQTNGAHVRVRQNATVLGGKILADLSIHSLEGPSALDTRLEIPQGKLIVLGQGNYSGKTADEGALYYIVRASIQSEAAP